MKAPAKRIISLLVLLALTASGLVFFSRALAMEEGPRKNGDFFRQDREYDVLLFGSSHVVNGIYPMQLWRDYGITAYNLSGHGCALATSYWEMRLAVTYHKPKVAVLDVLFAQSEGTQTDISLAHELLDPYPLSPLKAEAVRDMYESQADRAELLFPLDVYHNRWKDLDAAMVRRGLTGKTDLSPEKGAQARIQVTPIETPALIPQTQRMEKRTVALGYVEKFVTYCLAHDIIPVLTYLPCQIAEDWQESCNAALELGRQLGAQVLDMQYAGLLDDETDWYDQGAHLNPSGAKKTTDCLGAFLRDTLELPDHRLTEDARDWNGDYDAYIAYQAENMKSCETPEQLLTLATIQDFSVTVRISPDCTLPHLLRTQLQPLGDRATIQIDPTAAPLTVTVSGPDGEIMTVCFEKEPVAVDN